MEKLENKLIEIFGYTNTWLNHAEAKNGVVLTISLGIFFSLSKDIKNFNKINFIVLILIILLSILSSLLSFYPDLSNSKIKKIEKPFKAIGNFLGKDKISTTSNIKIFFGDISNNYSFEDSKKFVEDLSKDYYRVDKNEVSALEEDYAKEIIINSNIVMNKYCYFKCSIKLIIVFIIYFALCLFFPVIHEKEIKFLIINIM